MHPRRATTTLCAIHRAPSRWYPRKTSPSPPYHARAHSTSSPIVFVSITVAVRAVVFASLLEKISAYFSSAAAPPNAVAARTSSSGSHVASS